MGLCNMNAIIHELANVASDAIEDGTRIWQFVVVLPGASILLLGGAATGFACVGTRDVGDYT